MKVMIIEDNAEIVEYISIAFDIGWPGTELIKTSEGVKAIELIGSRSPDVVILDLGLPDVSGFDVLKNIRLFSDVPVIIATVRDSEADIVKGLDFGADEYIVKPFGQLELLARVKAVLRNRKGYSGLLDIITLGPLRFDPVCNDLACGTKSIHLTHTEGLILHLLMINAGKPVSFSEIADRIWGGSYPNASDTLRVYIRRLRAKIEKEPQCANLIQSRPGIGYFIEPPEYN